MDPSQVYGLVTEFGRPGVLEQGKCHLMLYLRTLVGMKEYLPLSALGRSDQEYDMNSWYCKLYLSGEGDISGY